jgi:hypothetical protein
MSDHDFDDDKTIEGDNESTSDFGSCDDPMSGYTSPDDNTVCGDETPDSGVNLSEGSSEENVDLVGHNTELTEELVSSLLSDFDEDYTIDLNISRDSGIDMSLSINSSSSVEDVLRAVDSQYYDDYDLEHDGHFLPRNLTLREAYIPKNGRVKAVERKITIDIREGRNGGKFPVDILRSATVKDLKHKMRNANLITYENPRLLSDTNELSDSRTLRSYNIHKNSTLLVANRCNGG